MIRLFIKSCIALLAACLFSTQAFALTINDDGVVGSVYTGTASANVDNVTDWANYLLSLGTSSGVVVADGNTPLDGTTETYQTGNNDYSGTLIGGTRVNGATPSIASYEWVMGKYDGQNAGYVLFNVEDYLAAAAAGTNTIPEFSYSVWGTNAGQYQLSNITGFGARVPEPGLVALLAIGLIGMVVARRKKTV